MDSALRLIVHLDEHQDNRLTTQRAGTMTSFAIDQAATLVTSEGDLSRTHFNPFPIHRLHVPPP